MAKPTEDAQSSNTLSSANTVLSWSHTNAGTYLIVSIAVNGAPGGSRSATYNGVSMSLIANVSGGGGSNRTLDIFGLANPSIGTHTVSCTWSTSRTAIGQAVSYFDVNTYSPTGNTNTEFGGVANASLAITDTTTNDIVISSISMYRATNTTAPTLTLGAGQTNIRSTPGNDGTNSYRLVTNYEDGNNGTVTMSATLSNQDDFRHVAFLLRGSGSSNMFLMF